MTTNTPTTFFSSDQHFGHSNILKYESATRKNHDGRTFATIDKMNDHLVDQWNSRVTPHDVVYCLGDVSFKMQVLRDVLPFLHGTKILVCGNHDPFFKLLTNGKSAAATERALEVGFSALHLEHTMTIPDIGLVKLSHFPYHPNRIAGMDPHALRYLNLHPTRGPERLLLHGHLHSLPLCEAYPHRQATINVGVDVWNMTPVSEKEIVLRFQELQLPPAHSEWGLSR